MTEFFPDGTEIQPWFYNTEIKRLEDLGPQMDISINGVSNDGGVYTKQFQDLIDRTAASGGGVIVVPPGVYKIGAVFFKPGVHLYVAEGGVLMGSDNSLDYPVMDTRIEGESCKYLPALINADGCDGIQIFGPGIIDGNGMRSWRAFRQRRVWNPACTNKDEQRARLIFISNSKDVTVAGLHLQNAQFWTCHIYKCERARFFGLRIFSPFEPIKAPSTDAIDIDVCRDVLVKNCYMHVNDDAVVLKGGKGPWADEAPENGDNENVLVEDCHYGFCHGCLTVGSESVHTKNVLVRRIRVDSGNNLLWLKMRPDTPQHYEYITVEDVEGEVINFININPWTQFFDLKGRTDKPISHADHVTMRNCRIKCLNAYNITLKEEQYQLADFTFEDLTLDAKSMGNEAFVKAQS